MKLRNFIHKLFKKQVKTNYKFGWVKDEPDLRDYKLKVTPEETLPLSVDLRPFCPAVYSQGQIGSCTANALGGAFQFEQMKQLKSSFIPSRLFIYYNERAMEGTINQDAGAMIRDGIKTMVKEGVCPETKWQYIENKFRDKPTDDCYTEALNNQVLEYLRISPHTLYEVKHCLADGYPVAFGFTIFKSFMNRDVATTGIAKMPLPNEQTIGGHAVCCHPETTVITKNGIKKIEDINIDDYVLTHLGNFKRVINVMNREINEEIIKIKNNFGEDLMLTKEHPILSKKYSKLTKLTQLADSDMLTAETNWNAADSIGNGNLLYSPIYLNNEIDSKIIYENEFFELLGMYLGDGNISIRYSKNENIKSMKLRFSLGKNYPELIERCKFLLKKYSSNEISEYDFGNHLNVTCYDTNLAKIIGGLCGYAKNKSINYKILSAPTEYQKELLRGWYETDGCNIVNGFMIFTSEENLMNDLCLILKRNNIIYNITKRKSRTGIIRNKCFNSKGGYSININNIDIDSMIQIKGKHRGIYYNNYLINRITDKPKVLKYTGKVYNLEVEDDNSYTANGIAVHNCAVGYDDAKEAILVRNSWGESWGMKGYFWLPYGYVEQDGLSADYWTIRLVE